MVEGGAGVEKDGVAVEDHDVEAAQVEENEHDEPNDDQTFITLP